MPSTFVSNRYCRLNYEGILIDTGASTFSTVGKEKFLALKLILPKIYINEHDAGEAAIRFGPGELTKSIGSTLVPTPAGHIKFHIVETQTPFIFCLADMDRLSCYLDNTRNILDKQNENSKQEIPVLRKWGHLWFFLPKNENALLFLTEVELRRLHRRFGHPAAHRLHKLLKNAGHDDITAETLEVINKLCHQCQMNSTAPRRFKFTLKDDQEFNYEVIVDVLKLGDKNALHVVDSATGFNAARFLTSMSAKDTFEALRSCWIDVYLGPPDVVTHDSGTNFASQEFRAEAKSMGISCKQIPTEAHWSIGKVERYHQPLRRAFKIISQELGGTVPDSSLLQMAVKAVNDTAGPNGLVPTLLVFGAYPRINADSPPPINIARRAEAVNKAMKQLRTVTAQKRVNNALSARNGPVMDELLALPVGSEVRVWRENRGWQGPYSVIETDGHNVILDMVNGPTKLRSTVCQPYYRSSQDPTTYPDFRPEAVDQQNDPPVPIPVVPRSRGRPKGSKNKAKPLDNTALHHVTRGPQVFLSRKEKNDRQLSIKLRNDGVISTSGRPFEASDAKEINDLVCAGVFKLKLFDPVEHRGRIFKSRMVREVKGIGNKPYEKSRLVIQGHSDLEKLSILTQSPTIQRMSQRLILSIAPSLCCIGMSALFEILRKLILKPNLNFSGRFLLNSHKK